MSEAARYLVYDLEYTAWAGSWERGWSGPGEHREIVQIGAVRVDSAFRELASLCLLVRPRINPVLSAYFTDLTAITQARLETEGMDIEAALDVLQAFAGPDLPMLSNGADAAVLAENCRLAGLTYPFDNRTIDVHDELRAASGRDHLFSADLPDLFGLEVTGRGHDALADARAVAGALRKVRLGGRKP